MFSDINKSNKNRDAMQWKSLIESKPVDFAKCRLLFLNYYPPFLAWIQKERQIARRFFQDTATIEQTNKWNNKLVDRAFMLQVGPLCNRWQVKISPVRSSKGELVLIEDGIALNIEAEHSHGIRILNVEVNKLDGKKTLIEALKDRITLEDLGIECVGPQHYESSRNVLPNEKVTNILFRNNDTEPNVNPFSFIAEIDVRTDWEPVLKDFRNQWEKYRGQHGIKIQRGKTQPFQPFAEDFDLYLLWISGAKDNDPKILEIYKEAGKNAEMKTIQERFQKRRKAFRNFVDPLGVSPDWSPASGTKKKKEPVRQK
ncbi:hypothetical protein WDW86_15815 [Bdellovibrionota bacterium FG-2]